MKKFRNIIVSVILIAVLMLLPTVAQAYEETPLPSYYSSKDLGYCTSVKTQKQSTCWAYSALSTFESLLLKNNLFTEDLNTDHLDSWATADSEGYGWQRSTGQSSYVYTALGYFTSWQGPTNSQNQFINVGATEVEYLVKADTYKIKKAIMDNGAVTGNYNSISSCLSSDGTSFALTEEHSSVNGHAISVVGWDDNYSKDNFDGKYIPENNGAWLCKNSWGENSNSLGGYFWISYEDYYLFNEDVFGKCYTVNNYQEISEKDYLYQNEIYGATYEFNYIKNADTITYMNVFDFSENGNTLDKVIFETTSLGAEYNVYFVPVNEEGTPETDKTMWTYLYNGTVDYSGYICCDFEDITVSQLKGAIAVEINTENTENIANGIGVCEWLSTMEGNLFFKPKTEFSKSFVIYEGKLRDVMSIYSNELKDDIGGTLVIKAITNGTVNTKTKGDVNLSGHLSINDATSIQKYLIKYTEHLIGDKKTNADFNGDGVIDISDVTAIQKSLAKIQN